MKLQRLISELQKFDLDSDVCIGNEDILCVNSEPSYWDGCKQILLREDTGFYDVVGAKICSLGNKIVIESHSVRDAIWENPKLPIEYDSDFARDHYEKSLEEHRAEVKKFK